MRFNLIVAMCRNNGIGYKGQLPWQIPQDLRYFAQVTKGDGINAVVMGRKTWQSLPVPAGKPRGLPQRDNFVLTRTDQFDMLLNHDRLIKTFASLGDLETYLSTNDVYEDVWVIGGAQVYAQFLDEQKIEKCYITYIDADFECDAFFPDLNPSKWKEIERTESYDITYQCNVNYLVYQAINQNTDCR